MKVQHPKAVDDYIASAQPFAQPILTHFRSLVHSVCPQAEEKIKWSFPHFEYKGSLCYMAAFKAHCSFGFNKALLIHDPDGWLADQGETGMGHAGKVTQLSDLPPDDVLMDFVKQAVKLNEENIKLPKPEKKELIVPEAFLDLLKTAPQALANWEKSAYSHQKEYLTWFEQAKKQETRDKRMAEAIVQLGRR